MSEQVLQQSEATPKTQERATTDFEKLLERDYVSPRILENAAEMREFDQRWRKAKVYAESDVVPPHFRGKTNNCYIACEIAERLRVSELMVMQNTFIVSGKLGFMGQFAIAVMNASGAFEDALEFEIQSDVDDPKHPSYMVRCCATRKGKKRRAVGPWVTWDMVNAEGWKAKWNSLPELMFRYRAAAFFARTVCPELLMGFQTVEELEDTEGNAPIARTNGNGHAKPSLSAIKDPSPNSASSPPRNGAESPHTSAGVSGSAGIPTETPHQNKPAETGPADTGAAVPSGTTATSPPDIAAPTNLPSGGPTPPTTKAGGGAPTAAPARGRPKAAPVAKHSCGAALDADGVCPNCGPDNQSPPPEDAPVENEASVISAAEKAEAYATGNIDDIRKDFTVASVTGGRKGEWARAARDIAEIPQGGMQNASEDQIRTAAYQFKLAELTAPKK